MFIRLTTFRNNMPFLVNLDQVTEIHVRDLETPTDGSRVFIIGDSEQTFVRESVTDIERLIQKQL